MASSTKSIAKQVNQNIILLHLENQCSQIISSLPNIEIRDVMNSVESITDLTNKHQSMDQTWNDFIDFQPQNSINSSGCKELCISVSETLGLAKDKFTGIHNKISVQTGSMISGSYDPYTAEYLMQQILSVSLYFCDIFVW